VFDRISRKHILVKIKEKIDFKSIARQLEVYYDSYQGRPSWSIEVMVKLLFLEIYYDVSDREIVRELKHNFLYRWFLDISFYEGEPDHSTLSRFRERIGEEGAKKIFGEIVRQAKEAGVLTERIKSIDATHIEANARKEGTVGFLNRSRDKIISFFKKDKKNETKEMKEEFVSRGPHGRSTPEKIKEEIKKTKDFIVRVKGWCTKKGEEYIEILKETVWNIENGIKDRIYSFTDLDARWGHKSKEKSFLGYKFHTAMDESGVITSVDTLPGNVNEGCRVVSFLKEEKERGLEGSGATMDALYDSGKNRKDIRELGLEPYILSSTKKRKLDKFLYDWERDVIICEEGESSIGKIRQENGDLHYFPQSICKNCKNVECRGDKKRQRVWISDAEKERLKTGKSVTREVAKNIRSRIEGKYGEGKCWHGLSRARWRGRCKTAVQGFLTFTVMNAKRLVRLIDKKEKQTCPS
jgi:transposase